jgi:tryptophan halogenase
MTSRQPAVENVSPRRVVVVGGGTAGWMTATGLVGLLSPRLCSVRLIESDEIATVGVGEATLPQLRAFNRAIGLVEIDMMHRAKATFKLGIEFRDWGGQDSSYVHPFGAFGHPMAGVDFHHSWLRAWRRGERSSIEDYSLSVAMARADRFAFPSEDHGQLTSTFDYAYHIDASLYARHLREFGERRGVVRTEGNVVEIDQDGEIGHIKALVLASGERIEGDLFIDCSGFRALLIGGALESPLEDWSKWLPCDRAFAVPTARTADLHPYTRVTAREAGWQWRIPLQHRSGNGYVFSSSFIDPARAVAELLANLDGSPLAEPRMLSFKPGRRLEGWRSNCVAIGLASGFLEPLESTSIYLVQRGVEALANLFPGKQPDSALAAEFNRRMEVEYERIRDFLILHYHVNGRAGQAMWDYCRSMAIPDSLQHKIDLYAASGQVERYRDGLFSPPSWIALFNGQGARPRAFHPLAGAIPAHELHSRLASVRAAVAAESRAMPSHADALEAYGMPAA